MSYTGTEIFDRSISIIDELSETGAITDALVREYRFRAPALLDLWQHEMAKSGDLYRTVEISCFRKQNLIDEISAFRTVEYVNVEQVYESPVAHCFFFGVDGVATVSVEQMVNGVWQAVSGTFVRDGVTPTAFTGSIAVTPNARSFSYYKGVLMPDITATRMRLRFGGPFYYRHKDRALAPYRYQAATNVPDFMPWYRIEMPADFKSRTQVIDEYSHAQHRDSGLHRWESNDELYVKYSYEGTIRIKYVPIPVKITALTQTLEVDGITAISGAYYLAEHFAMADQNTFLAQRCRDKFRELKAEARAKTNKAEGFSDIKDVLGISDIR